MRPIADLIVESDNEMLREHGPIVEEFESVAHDPFYGPYPGGDPRQFRPDLECNTAEEVEALRAAQAAAERGEYVDEGPQCMLLGNGRLHKRSGFGMLVGDAVAHPVLVRVYADGFREELV